VLTPLSNHTVYAYLMMNCTSAVTSAEVRDADVPEIISSVSCMMR
jgi:hypothetical protein